MSKSILRASNSNRDAPDHLLVAYLSIMAVNRCSLASSCHDLGWMDIDIRVAYADSAALDSEESAFMEFLDIVRSSDFIIVNCHGDPDCFTKFGRLVTVIDLNQVPMFMNCSSEEVNRSYAHLSGFDERDQELFRRYIELGGEKNGLGALLWLCRHVKGYDVNVPQPFELPCQGIYRPGVGMVKDEAGYLASFDGSAPAVGVLFHQSMWVEDNLSSIDALIEAIESKGCRTLAVFFMSIPDKTNGSIGIGGIIDSYLLRGRRPVVDSLVLVGGFSQNACYGVMDLDRMSRNIFTRLDVPVIQACIINESVRSWAAGDQPLGETSVAFSIIQPEFDGQIISVPLCFIETDNAGNNRYAYVPDRVERIAGLAVNWAKLRRIDPGDVRVAIILNSDGGSDGRLGSAYGLDAMESLRAVMARLSKEGITIDRMPRSSDALSRRILRGCAGADGWGKGTASEQAADRIPFDLYTDWFMELPDALKAEMNLYWGRPPGEILVQDGRILVPGIIDGNVFIGVQPTLPAGYADLDPAPSHQYYGFYRWIRDVFKADVLVHMGTRGTLEELPGRRLALTSGCWPDVLIGSMPNLYPFITTDPGEGAAAKRRTGSVLIGYMEPPIVEAGSYGDLRELDALLTEHMRLIYAGQSAKLEEADSRICGLVRKMGVLSDLDLPSDLDDRAIIRYAGDLYRYIQGIKSAHIQCGLHVLGRLPKGHALAELICSLDSDCTEGPPSLVSSIARSRGLDIDELRSDPSGSTDGEVNAALHDRMRSEALSIIDGIVESRFRMPESLSCCGPEHSKTVEYICRCLYPALSTVGNEMDMLVHGIRGGFVPSGPSGSPMGGNLHIFPTGRNICVLDPLMIPYELSWERGSSMADATVERYVGVNGRYPESVSVALSSTDLMNSGGDEVAYVLRLMGVRPVRSARSGAVTGIEVTPVGELGRPRVDVVLRISTLIAQSFPNVLRLFSEGFAAVSELDETEAENSIRRHLSADISGYIRSGMDPESARALSSVRVFGTGRESIEGSRRRGRRKAGADDRSAVIAYDADGRRIPADGLLSGCRSDPDLSIIGSGDLFGSRMEELIENAGDATRRSGRSPKAVISDGIRPLSTQMAFLMRTRVLNPRWIDGLMAHGFSGAAEMSRVVNGLFRWAVGSDAVEPWMFRDAAQTFVFSDRVRRWMIGCNPRAMRDISGNLFMAVEEGVWNAPADTVLRLRNAYLEAEAELEGEDVGAS